MKVPRDVSPADEHAPVTVDCDSCQVRNIACGDCVLSVLIGAPNQWDDEERRALAVLAESGLVPPLRLVVGGKRGGQRAHPDVATG